MKTTELAKHFGKKLNYSGHTQSIVSPIDNQVLGEVDLASRADIAQEILRIQALQRSYSKHHVLSFLNKLKAQIESHRDLIAQYICLETGFIAQDCAEIIDGAIEYLEYFNQYAEHIDKIDTVIPFSYMEESTRKTILTRKPFNCVSVILPANATFTLAIVTIASALYAGSKIILRPSLQSALTGLLLDYLIKQCRMEEQPIAIVNCKANDFLDMCYQSKYIDLIHYIGSNQYAMAIMQQSFKSGKLALIDGQGNGLLYLDESYPIDEAIDIICNGSTRYNGCTCVSVNGLLIEQSIYNQVKNQLVDVFSGLRVGHPLDNNTQIGPLFNQQHALALKQQVKQSPGSQILCGGNVKEAYFSPAIIEKAYRPCDLTTKGIFGPALWIRSIQEPQLWDTLNENHYPLSDTILSKDQNKIESFILHSPAPRVCVNTDPSLESMFEPWGGYPPNSLNTVSMWIDKYYKSIQLDGEEAYILNLSSDWLNK